MGICIKNPARNVHPNRNQQPQGNPTFHQGPPRRVSYLRSFHQAPIAAQPINTSQFPLSYEAEAGLNDPAQQDLVDEYQIDSQSMESLPEVEQDMKRLELLKQVSSSGFRQSSNDEICGICYQKYHIFNKWPMQICMNQHIICDQCVKDFQKLSNQDPFSCPFCRLLVFNHDIKPSGRLFKTLHKGVYNKEDEDEDVRFFCYAFEHELYEIAKAYKENRRKDLKKLKHLAFENKLIEEFAYFKHFKNVVYLQLEHNRISLSSCLLPLKDTLKIINLSYNKIKSLKWISQFNQLQILACQHNYITQVQFSENFLHLKELYLIGNTICDHEIIRNFKELQFKNMRILSIESLNKELELFYHQQMNGKPEVHNQEMNNERSEEKALQKDNDLNLPELRVLIIPGEQPNTRQVKVAKMCTSHSYFNFIEEAYITTHLQDSYFYGNLFEFEPDGKNPHCQQYSFSQGRLTKLSSNFTTINSRFWIPHVGKQAVKLKLREKNSNIMLGICTRSIRYSASVYSKEFIGITFWGNVYNKSDSLPINCDLRINDGSVIAMVLDFDRGEISWYIDRRKISELKHQKSFLRSKQLYFLYGARDSNVEVQFIV